MNLELIDPFGRQIPDRIDSTLQLPPSLHFRKNENGIPSGMGGSSGDGPNGPQVGAGKTSTKDSSNRPSSTSTGSSKSKKGTSHTASASSDTDPEWKAAYHVSFHRRGTYLAVGYGSGTVAVFSLLSRSLAALYPRNDDRLAEGVTSVTWSRRSRTLLSGAAGDKTIVLWDTTHPYGSEECCQGLDNVSGTLTTGGNGAMGIAEDRDGEEGDLPDTTSVSSSKQSGTKSAKHDDKSAMAASVSASRPTTSITLPTRTILTSHSLADTRHTSFADAGDTRYTISREKRILMEGMALMGYEVPATIISDDFDRLDDDQHGSDLRSPVGHRCPCVTFEFPDTVGGSLQVSPRIPTGGLAALSNGTLVLFWFHRSAFYVHDDERQEEDNEEMDEDSELPAHHYAPKALIVPLWDEPFVHFITCAAFDHHGDRVYAATKDGTLLGFDAAGIWNALEASVVTRSQSDGSTPQRLPRITPHFKLSTSGGSSAWHLLVSRNGKYMVINSSDGSLRLYATQKCWDSGSAKTGKEENNSEQLATSSSEAASATKPLFVFQDVVSKVKFASCDLSGDGEFVVGGANGDDNKYELYIWNTATGVLMDKLTGASVQLYSVAWHPTRAFLAVATSDGLIDVWGPKLNWTAFAPDFQSLPMNVEYVEREDEFDLDDDGKFITESGSANGKTNNEDEPVDVTTVEKVPVFASDSEDEEEVFSFETKVVNLLSGRKSKPQSGDD